MAIIYSISHCVWLCTCLSLFFLNCLIYFITTCVSRQVTNHCSSQPPLQSVLQRCLFHLHILIRSFDYSVVSPVLLSPYSFETLLLFFFLYKQRVTPHPPHCSSRHCRRHWLYNWEGSNELRASLQWFSQTFHSFSLPNLIHSVPFPPLASLPSVHHRPVVNHVVITFNAGYDSRLTQYSNSSRTRTSGAYNCAPLCILRTIELIGNRPLVSKRYEPKQILRLILIGPLCHSCFARYYMLMIIDFCMSLFMYHFEMPTISSWLLQPTWVINV